MIKIQQNILRYINWYNPSPSTRNIRTKTTLARRCVGLLSVLYIWEKEVRDRSMQFQKIKAKVQSSEILSSWEVRLLIARRESLSIRIRSPKEQPIT